MFQRCAPLLIIVLAANVEVNVQAPPTERCQAPLRLAYYDLKTAIDVETRNWLVRYDVCRTEFKSEAEARAQGLDLEFVYSALKFNLASRDNFQRLMKWKMTECKSYLDTGSSAKFQQLVEQVINVEALKQIKTMYEACLLADKKGLICSASSPTGNVTSVFVHWAPFASGLPDPVIEMATVDGASVAPPPGKPNRVLFPKGTVVPIGGLIRNVYRTDPRTTVAFNIDTKKYGACRIPPIPPSPRYSVIATFGGTAEAKEVTTQDRTHNRKWTACVDSRNSTPIVDCGPNGWVATGAEMIDRPTNPYVTQDRADCFRMTPSVNEFNSAYQGGPQCYRLGVSVNECRAVSVFGDPACTHYLAHGVDFTVQVSF